MSVAIPKRARGHRSVHVSWAGRSHALQKNQPTLVNERVLKGDLQEI